MHYLLKESTSHQICLQNDVFANTIKSPNQLNIISNMQNENINKYINVDKVPVFKCDI